MPAQVGLPVRQIVRHELLFESLEERRLGGIDDGGRSETDVGVVCVPVKIGRKRLELRGRQLVEQIVRVAFLHTGERRLREFRLDGHHHGGIGLCFRGVFAKQLEHAGHVLQVPLAGLPGFRVGLHVVVAIRQTQSFSAGKGDHLLRISEVLIRAKPEQSTRSVAGMLGGDNRRHLLFGFQSGDGVQRRAQGGEAGLLDGRLVHAGVKKIADLLFFPRALARGVAGLDQNAPQVLEILGGQLRVHVPRRLVGGDGVLANPVPARVAEEILTRVDGLVHGADVEAGAVRERGQGFRIALGEGGRDAKDQDGKQYVWAHSQYPW